MLSPTTLALFTSAFAVALCQQAPVVDLGYARYQGFVNSTTNVQSFLGLRYAAPPERWQRPIKPATDRTTIQDATMYGAICAQAASHLAGSTTDPNNLGSEDCLFVNVHGPANVTSQMLPVVVWIHGGGYGQGNNRADPSYLYSLTNDEFVFVTIQYRLGAFGFLASNDVRQEGIVNAGLLDQVRALEWVSEHIATFGGDPNRVTIWGESAGAGSVMHQLLAKGGTHGNHLFQQAIAASPYLPMQHRYDDTIPTMFYNRLAAAVGCSVTSQTSAFQCLSSVDSALLKSASNNVSQTANYGQWAFLPVTDGQFVQSRPSEQLVRGKVPRHVAVLVGSNQLEGTLFTPTNITTTADFNAYVQRLLPSFSKTALSKISQYYPEPSASGNLYTSQSERASTLYADTTFNCPAIWLSSAFPNSYRYLYDVSPAFHGFDLPHYLPSQFLVGVAPDLAQLPFDRAFSGMFVSFIQDGLPSIVVNTSFIFPKWDSDFSSAAQQVRFTEHTSAAGIVTPVATIEDGQYLTRSADRCDFWLAYSAIVPE